MPRPNAKQHLDTRLHQWLLTTVNEEPFRRLKMLLFAVGETSAGTTSTVSTLSMEGGIGPAKTKQFMGLAIDALIAEMDGWCVRENALDLRPALLDWLRHETVRKIDAAMSAVPSDVSSGVATQIAE